MYNIIKITEISLKKINNNNKFSFTLLYLLLF